MFIPHRLPSPPFPHPKPRRAHDERQPQQTAHHRARDDGTFGFIVVGRKGRDAGGGGGKGIAFPGSGGACGREGDVEGGREDGGWFGGGVGDGVMDVDGFVDEDGVGLGEELVDGEGDAFVDGDGDAFRDGRVLFFALVQLRDGGSGDGGWRGWSHVWCYGDGGCEMVVCL